MFTEFTYNLANWLKKKQKVFFLFGAGCSYYSGVPLMNNFLDYAPIDCQEEWKKLQPFLEKVRKSQDLVQTNLYNIEELLTLIETYETFASSEEENQEAEKYKKACIEIIKNIVGKIDRKLLIKLRDEQSNPSKFGGKEFAWFDFFSSFSHYAVWQIKQHFADLSYLATFNYDDAFDRFYGHLEWDEKQVQELPLAYLHGSVKENNMIAPTQNKSFGDEKIKKAWQDSIEFLKDADHIVICGY